MNFNIYNEKRIDDWIDAMIGGQLVTRHVDTWFYTIFRRWARKQPSMLRLALPNKLLDSPLLHDLYRKRLDGGLVPDESSVLSESRFDLIPTPTEDWAMKAMLNGELYTFRPSIQVTRLIPHWLDFMRTLPDRPIRYTVESLMKAVARWDEQALRRKTIIDSTTGVTEVWSSGEHYVVRLDSQDSVKAEGALMGHCVWSQRYDLRRGSTLFSLRRRNVDRPLATMEVTEPVSKLRLADLAGLIGEPFQSRLTAMSGSHSNIAQLLVDRAMEQWETNAEGQVVGNFTAPLPKEHMPLGKPVLAQICTVRNRALSEEIVRTVHAWFSEKYPTCSLSPQAIVEVVAAAAELVPDGVNPNNRPGPLRRLLGIALPDVWEPVREIGDDDVQRRMMHALGIPRDMLTGRPDCAGYTVEFNTDRFPQQPNNN